MSEPIDNALFLLKRQSELEALLLRRPGGARVSEERELIAVRGRLERYPEAVKAILETATELHRPIDALSCADVLRTA